MKLCRVAANSLSLTRITSQAAGASTENNLAFATMSVCRRTFWADTDMGYEFLCGSGVLYSTERQNGQKRIQWVVILRIGNNSNHLTLNIGLEKNAIYIQQSLEENTRATDDKDKRFTDTDEVKKADEIIRGTLTEPLPNSSGYYLDFDCLKQRQKDFFENAYEGLLDQIDMETAWKRIYDQQEGNQ